MKHQTTRHPAEQNLTDARTNRLPRLDENSIAVLNGGVHAAAADRETHTVAGVQDFGRQLRKHGVHATDRLTNSTALESRTKVRSSHGFWSDISLKNCTVKSSAEESWNAGKLRANSSAAAVAALSV